MRKLFYSALMIIGFGGCQAIIDEKLPLEEPVTFSTKIENLDGATKTAMTENRQVVWSKGDQIAIFKGNNVADTYQVADDCANSQNGEFTKIQDNGSGERLDATVALYPYTDNLSVEKVSEEDSNGDAYQILGFVLPERQTYCEGSFGEGTFPMVAITDVDSRSLNFKNVLGAVKLQLIGTELVKSIKIKGKNGEKLSGAVTITVYSDGQSPSVRMSDEYSTSVTLDCGDGVQLNESEATTFIIALPPIVFADGFIVQVYDEDGKMTQELEATTLNEIIRSSILVMPVKKDEPADSDQHLGSDDIDYTCEIGTDNKRLYAIKQKVNGELVTYSKDDEEISREPFSKDLNLEVLFDIPDIVYVDSESQLSTVKLTSSSKSGDIVNNREDDGFNIYQNSMNYSYGFDAKEKVIATSVYEKLKYGNSELPYTYIYNIKYRTYESQLNKELTNDDTIVYDVTLYFNVELQERNLETAKSQTYPVSVSYKRVYERVEYTVAENISHTSQFGTEDKRLYTIEQKVNGDLVTYSKNNREISRESFSKDLSLEVLFDIPDIVYVDSESQVSTVKLTSSSKSGGTVNNREDDGFNIYQNSMNYSYGFDAKEKVIATSVYEKLKYGNSELPYTYIYNIKYRTYESQLNKELTNDDTIVYDVTLYFNVELQERNSETTTSKTYPVSVSYKRIYERVEYTVAENISLTSQFGTEDKRLYTIEQKVDGELVTYSKYNEEILRESFSKDLSLEVLFDIPDIVYVDSESQVSTVKLTSSSKSGDTVNNREDDGFNIYQNSMNYSYGFDAKEKVIATSVYEKLKYGNSELPYTYIYNIKYRTYESQLNKELTNDDAIVYDVTLYFNVELKERNSETATSETYPVSVSYKRVYERKEHVEIQ